MWKVSRTPINYHPPGNEEWCILDEDGDIEDFYATREQADLALEEMRKRRAFLAFHSRQFAPMVAK
jgi:hypothetical protein